MYANLVRQSRHPSTCNTCFLKYNDCIMARGIQQLCVSYKLEQLQEVKTVGSVKSKCLCIGAGALILSNTESADQVT